MQDYIQRQVEYQPDGNVDAQDIRDVDIPYQRHIDQDKHQREHTDAYHHHSYFQPASQQLVVDMVLVRQERVLLVSQPVAHHSHHVEQRHQHGGKRQHHVIVAHGTGMHIHRTQVNHQETDDISQRQRSRITHEELPAPHLVSKHIVIPEWDDYTQCRDTQQGIGEQSQPDMQPRQSHQRDGTEPRSQTVDAVNQVDGIGNIHHDEHGKRHAEPW